jgi:dihydroorotase-like cyclic amidohydrolase
MVTEAKEAGVDAYAETCVRYLYMTSDDLVERAPELWFTPPPRSEADREGLWERLASGEIDMVNADHAPAPPEMLDQPNENAIEAPFHNTSVEVLLPLLLEGVSEGRIGLPRVAEVFSTNPARITGLYPRKGAIRVGSDADLVIVDMDREVTLRDEDVVSKCGWTPYDGMTVQGVPEATYVRGELVVEDREVVGEPGYGEFVNPDHDTTPWAE